MIKHHGLTPQVGCVQYVVQIEEHNIADNRLFSTIVVVVLCSPCHGHVVNTVMCLLTTSQALSHARSKLSFSSRFILRGVRAAPVLMNTLLDERMGESRGVLRSRTIDLGSPKSPSRGPKGPEM